MSDEPWHAALELVAIGLVLACAFVWFGVLTRAF
jgi:hypothetical protein